MSNTWIAQQIRACAAAFTFLTRLPVGGLVKHDLNDLSNSGTYFPLVGLVVGSVGAATFILAQMLWSPPIAIVMSVIAMVLVTGAFHEDALADSLDGFGGGWTRVQVLAIMKDSRVGSYALIGMVLAVALRISALLSIHANATTPDVTQKTLQAIVDNSGAVARALIAAHVLSRCSSLWLIRSYEYVRADDPTAKPSAGKPFVNSVTNAKLAIATALSFSLVGVLLPQNGLAVIAVALVVAFLAGRYFKRRIGGITGDALGAANQTVEVCAYLTLAAYPVLQ